MKQTSQVKMLEKWAAMGGNEGARSVEEMLHNPVKLATMGWEKWAKESMSAAKQVGRSGIFATRPVQQSTIPQEREQGFVVEGVKEKDYEGRKGSKGGVERYMGRMVKEEFVKQEAREAHRVELPRRERYLVPANPREQPGFEDLTEEGRQERWDVYGHHLEDYQAHLQSQHEDWERANELVREEQLKEDEFRARPPVADLGTYILSAGENGGEDFTFTKSEAKHLSIGVVFVANSNPYLMESKDEHLGRLIVWNIMVASTRGTPFSYIMKECKVEFDVAWVYQKVKTLMRHDSSIRFAVRDKAFWARTWVEYKQVQLMIHELREGFEELQEEGESCGVPRNPRPDERLRSTVIAWVLSPNRGIGKEGTAKMVKIVGKLEGANQNFTVDDLVAAVVKRDGTDVTMDLLQQSVAEEQQPVLGVKVPTVDVQQQLKLAVAELERMKQGRALLAVATSRKICWDFNATKGCQRPDCRFDHTVDQARRDAPECEKCGKKFHSKEECKGEWKCDRCGKGGHAAKECNQRYRKQANVAILQDEGSDYGGEEVWAEERASVFTDGQGHLVFNGGDYAPVANMAVVNFKDGEFIPPRDRDTTQGSEFEAEKVSQEVIGLPREPESEEESEMEEIEGQAKVTFEHYTARWLRPEDILQREEDFCGTEMGGGILKVLGCETGDHAQWCVRGSSAIYGLETIGLVHPGPVQDPEYQEVQTWASAVLRHEGEMARPVKMGDRWGRLFGKGRASDNLGDGPSKDQLELRQKVLDEADLRLSTVGELQRLFELVYSGKASPEVHLDESAMQDLILHFSEEKWPKTAGQQGVILMWGAPDDVRGDTNFRLGDGRIPVLFQDAPVSGSGGMKITCDGNAGGTPYIMVYLNQIRQEYIRFQSAGGPAISLREFSDTVQDGNLAVHSRIIDTISELNEELVSLKDRVGALEEVISQSKELISLHSIVCKPHYSKMVKDLGAVCAAGKSQGGSRTPDLAQKDRGGRNSGSGGIGRG